MIVVDASAALAALLNAGPARTALGSQQVHVPHLIDSEITNGLRRQVSARSMGSEEAWTALDAWRHLGVTRYPVFALLERVWSLRDNLSAYDACYVALAESLGCELLTADARLSRAPGARCTMMVVPH